MKHYPRTLVAPNGYTTVTVQNEEQEARVRARFKGKSEPEGKDASPKPIMRRKGRMPNVRKP
ncbi:hypothetical protein IGS75_01425 [Gluconobacter sphaericus]|uniref:hypothetical protein n=1 Tax=Gluconobacter sphaericus TaxID=574987 RepID=UPI001920DE2F|nr:hypothetical protein [Gluconobacter sphaericus]QQX91331.1 hypothetical protein IGS75_01425 [Gluconobacter sphaericus]